MDKAQAEGLFDLQEKIHTLETEKKKNRLEIDAKHRTIFQLKAEAREAKRAGLVQGIIYGTGATSAAVLLAYGLAVIL